GGGAGKPEVLEPRGQEVEGLHLLRDPPAAVALAGELHQQRDADELVEHAAAVQPLAVVLELLAVVGHEDDERAIVEAALLQLPDEAAELLVAVRDLAVVLRDQTVAVERLLEVVTRVLARVIGGRVRLVL